MRKRLPASTGSRNWWGDILDRMGVTIAAIIVVGGWISEAFKDGYPAAGVLMGLSLTAIGVYIKVSIVTVPKRKETDHE